MISAAEQLAANSKRGALTNAPELRMWHATHTGFLIVMSVRISAVVRIHSRLLAHQYRGIIRKAKLKGRCRP